MRPAEESVRPTRAYPTASYPFSASLRLSHVVFIGVDLLNRQSQDVKQKIQALTRLVNLAHENRLCGSDSSQEVAAHYGRGKIEYQCIALC